MNDIARVSLRLAQPIAADRYAGLARHRRAHRDRRGDERHRRGGDDPVTAARTRREIARWAEALEERARGDPWRRSRPFPPGRVGFATGFGPEGCVLVDVAARASLPIDVFTIDTGTLFPRRMRSGTGWRPATGSASAAWRARLRTGRSGGRRRPGRRIGSLLRGAGLPLRAELGRFDAWVTAIRRDQTPDRANAAVVEWDDKFEP